jgi:glutathione reductase (NADPH)
MNMENVATVIFSHPPIGIVGLSEEDAIKKFGKDNVKTYKSKFTNMFYSPALSDDRKHQSLFKIICHLENEKTERVIGCHAIGKGVDEMMQGVSVAITMGATK